MSKARRPSIPPPEGAHRGRAPSLSIARSPAVLSSASFANTPPHHDLNHQPHPHAHSGPSSLSHSSTSHPHPQPTSGLSRSLSRPKPTLSDIPSEEEIPLTNITGYTKSVTFDNASDIDVEGDVESEGSTEYARGGVEVGAEGRGEDRYLGGFQAPDSRELLGIGLSIAGVGVLALAAGLTTVLNWVL